MLLKKEILPNLVNEYHALEGISVNIDTIKSPNVSVDKVMNNLISKCEDQLNTSNEYEAAQVVADAALVASFVSMGLGLGVFAGAEVVAGVLKVAEVKADNNFKHDWGQSDNDIAKDLGVEYSTYIRTLKENNKYINDILTLMGEPDDHHRRLKIQADVRQQMYHMMHSIESHHGGKITADLLKGYLIKMRKIQKKQTLAQYNKMVTTWEDVSNKDDPTQEDFRLLNKDTVDWINEIDPHPADSADYGGFLLKSVGWLATMGELYSRLRIPSAALGGFLGDSVLLVFAATVVTAIGGLVMLGVDIWKITKIHEQYEKSLDNIKKLRDQYYRYFNNITIIAMKNGIKEFSDPSTAIPKAYHIHEQSAIHLYGFDKEKALRRSWYTPSSGSALSMLDIVNERSPYTFTGNCNIPLYIQFSDAHWIKDFYMFRAQPKQRIAIKNLATFDATFYIADCEVYVDEDTGIKTKAVKVTLKKGDEAFLVGFGTDPGYISWRNHWRVFSSNNIEDDS